MKYAHGEYMGLFWESDDHPHYVRGHVTEDEAKAALESWETGSGDCVVAVHHRYGRYVFSQSEDYARELAVYDAPQRGAFKLTEVTA